jgi:hypothetical protein
MSLFVGTLYSCVCMDVCGEGSSIDIKQEGSGGRGRESGGKESRHLLVVCVGESLDF